MSSREAPGVAGYALVRTFWQELPIATAVIGLLGALVFLLSGQPYLLNILAVTFLYAGLGTAWNIIGGFGGQFSMAHSVFFAIGAYVAANLYLRFQISPWLSLLPAALAAAAIATLVSWPVFRLRGPFFAIATMALAEVALALATHFDSVTGGARGIVIPFRAGLENMIFRDRLSYALLMLGFCAVALVVAIAVVRSRLGYYLQSVRDNDRAALASGIDVLRTKLVGMAISAALTGIGGVLFMMYVRVADPPALLSLFDVGVKIALVALIGGVGTIYGPLVGALLVVSLESWLRTQLGSQFPGSSLVALGAVLTLAAMYFKHGVVGTLGDAMRWHRRKAAS